MNKYFSIVPFLLGLCLLSCSQSPKREVAAVAVKSSSYWSEMAEYGNFIMLDPRVFQDSDLRVYGSCRSDSPPDWMDHLKDYLKLLNQQPGSFSKFHVLDIQRADESDVSLNTSGNGVTILRISYRKIQKSKQVDSRLDLEGMNCGETLSGGKITLTKFEWPDPQMVMEIVSKAEARNVISAWRFDRAFLRLLYENEVFPVLDESTFEAMNSFGWVFQEALNKWGNELRVSENKKLPGLEEWKKILVGRSAFANKILLFHFSVSEKDSDFGLTVKPLVKNFEKRGKNIIDPVYFFLQLKRHSHSESIPALKDFNDCFEKVQSEVEAILNEKKASPYQLDPANFMAPGFRCRKLAISRL